MLMIQPLSPEGSKSCCTICAAAYLQPKKTDLALTAMVISHTFSDVSCILTGGWPASREIPALLTSLVFEGELKPSHRGEVCNIHIKPTVFCYCLPNQILNVLCFAHVRLNEYCSPTILPNQLVCVDRLLGGHVSAGLRLEVSADKVSTFSHVGKGYSSPNPRRGAGDNADSSMKALWCDG